MSDTGSDDECSVENPDPEADTIAEAAASLNAESDSNLDFAHDSNIVAELDCFVNNSHVDCGISADASQHRDNHSDCQPSSSNTCEAESADSEKQFSENPEGFEDAVWESAPGCQLSSNAESFRTHNDSLTEGDQHAPPDVHTSTPSTRNNLVDSGPCFGIGNEYAAEDEQYFSSSTSNTGCTDAYESGNNSNHAEIVLADHMGEGAGAEEAVLKHELHSHRTESSTQLEEFDSPEYGAGSHVEYKSPSQHESMVDKVEAEGACASGQNDLMESEDEMIVSQTHSVHEKEKEPTESDQELSKVDGHDESLGLKQGDRNISSVEEISEEDKKEIVRADVLSTNNEVNRIGVGKLVPEDELNGLSSPLKDCSVESYQPECDQSEEGQAQGVSSHEVCERLDYSSPMVNVQGVPEQSLDEERTLIEDQRDTQRDESKANLNPEYCDITRNQDTEIHKDLLNSAQCSPAFQKEMGAIPKSGKSVNHKTGIKSNKIDENNAKDSGTEETSEEADSEEELLSELDATLKNSQSGSFSSEISARSKAEQTLEDDSSCDNCVKNNLICSFKGKQPNHRGQAHIPCLRDLKKQLHQAKQILLERECEVSRLKGDLSDYRLRCETLTTERDSARKEVQQLKSHNSDDLYIPQIKELEYTIAQQTNEIRGLKDKLSSHDAAAKRAIATLQQEMKVRVEQVQKQADEANKEKDSMVVKFAQAEHKNLEYQKQAERAENKLKEMEKERDAFLQKMKAVKDQRSKLAADIEAKNAEMSNIQKELEKHREMVASADIRVKWAQNKLKSELEAHKDTKVQLEKMTAKLKEAKEETQQIRKDCQAIIKTYQESEEVKSNTLDKELKLKESELLEREVQKNNFELAHVKTQRELEQVKAELRESQSKFSSLAEKLSTVEGEKEQSALTATRYADIIQKQKKEIQELREKIESLVHFRTDFTSAQEMIKSLDSDITELKLTNKELTAEMEACRRRETDNLDLTAKLSRKNAELQSENTTLSNKVLSLTGDLQAVKMENQDAETQLKELADDLAAEKKMRLEETQSLNTRLAGKCKAVEDLSRKLEDEKDEIKTLKRKHTNNVKDLTRQLQQVRRKLENYEASTNGDRDTISLGSRTSSNGSLNTVGVAEQPTMQVVQPSSATHNSVHRHPSPEQEYPVVTQQVEVDKQILIERIVKLQRALARKNEKLEFMEDHVSQLIDEIQKKNKIIQTYIMKEEGGTMTSEFRDQAKAEISRKQSIMGSVYSSHSNDGTMTLDLSLEINRKLQAVLEDTILKNMTLKESLDTLGQEIARLSQENRQLQLHIQGKSKNTKSGSSRR